MNSFSIGEPQAYCTLGLGPSDFRFSEVPFAAIILPYSRMQYSDFFLYSGARNVEHQVSLGGKHSA